MTLYLLYVANLAHYINVFVTSTIRTSRKIYLYDIIEVIIDIVNNIFAKS